jgi:hypothetical protein
LLQAACGIKASDGKEREVPDEHADPSDPGESEVWKSGVVMGRDGIRRLLAE